VTCVNDRIVQIQDDRREDDPPAGIAGDDCIREQFGAVGCCLNTSAGPSVVTIIE